MLPSHIKAIKIYNVRKCNFFHKCLYKNLSIILIDLGIEKKRREAAIKAYFFSI